MKRILVISASYDPHADRIVQEIEATGGVAERFNIDQLPHQLWADLRINNGGSKAVLPGASTDVDAVYYRRLAMIRGHGLWSHIPETSRQFAVSEAEATLFGICHTLSDRPWVNDFSNLEVHVNKPVGLMVASEVGLIIPDTVVTNNPDTVRRFYYEHDGKIVFKAASVNAVHLTPEYSKLFYTSRVKEEQLSESKLISALPGIYQAEVERDEELRVTVIDDHIFTVSVLATDPSEVDWRRGLGKGLRFRRSTLSDVTAEMILTFMKRMGLRYGAIDLILRPDGEIVFLEVNPQGAYLWLERDLGIPITKTIARCLMDSD